jgi:hypothetical protein
MDIHQTIRDLYVEKAKVDQVIALLEELRQDCSGVTAETQAKRHGRSCKPPQEHREVSKRMKRYWASRHPHSIRKDPL